jgi:MFS superfamily sulfate permease-like transporter
VITISAILATDLLKGMAIGLIIGLFFVIKANYRAAITMTQDGSSYLLTLNKDVAFLNKALLRKLLLHVKPNSTLVIDARKSQFIDHDIVETIDDFLVTAPDHNISVEIRDIYGKERLKKHEEFVILQGQHDQNSSGKKVMIQNKMAGL